jgi:hypothetical protein
MVCVLTLRIRNRSIINILFTRYVVGLVSKNFRTSPARQKLAENFLARLGRTDVLQRCWSYEPSNHEPLVNRLPDLALFAGLNQRDIFVGVRSAERIKNTFGDDAPILNFCRTFGHHRSPSPANQYCGYRTLSPVALLRLYQIAHPSIRSFAFTVVSH